MSEASDKSSRSHFWAVVGGITAVAGLLLTLYIYLEEQPATAEDRVEYIAQVDAICQSNKEAVNALGEEPLGDRDAMYAFYQERDVLLADLINNWVNAPVSYPEKDDGQIKDMWNTVNRIQLLMKRGIEELGRGDDTALNESINEIQSLVLDMRAKTLDYGFNVCPSLWH